MNSANTAIDSQPLHTASEIGGSALLDRANREPPHWSDDEILAWDAHDFRELESFITSIDWCDQASINVHRVVGTQHPDYQGWTWLRFLNGGKRMAINLPLHEENPGYYLETERKRPMMYFEFLDGVNFYIASDGTHRTGIAKFDFHYEGRTSLHGVSVTDHRIDSEFYRRYKALQSLSEERRLPYQFSGAQEPLGRSDSGGWCLDEFKPLMLAINYETRQEEKLDRGGAGRLLGQLSGRRHRRFWTGVRNRQRLAAQTGCRPIRMYEKGNFHKARKSPTVSSSRAFSKP